MYTVHAILLSIFHTLDIFLKSSIKNVNVQLTFQIYKF